MKVLVLTISDRASKGIYADESGPAIETVLRGHVSDIEIFRAIVPDEKKDILAAFSANIDVDVILTTGGTGLSPRDVTPEVTQTYCDRLVPGIAEMLRAESLKQTPNAVLSRGAAGAKGTTLIVNLPGSVRAAEFCAGLVAPLLEHAVRMMKGQGH